MFGTQGHSFGTAPFGRKDSQLLQDMLRDRNGGGSFHDTGKLVDLADPGILQARMSHQQSNAGVGQGLFGGQNQGGYNPMMQHSGVPRW